MTDHKNAHLAWIHKTKTFCPRYPSDYRVPYLQVMTELYRDPRITQEMAQAMYLSDKVWFAQSSQIDKTLDKLVYEKVVTPDNLWFVTIGFNHQTWRIDKCCSAIERILDMNWVTRAKANFELHRENGLHPHVHFIIETKEPKSRVLDKIFRPRYIKDLVLARNHIDVKKAMPHHMKYIELDKTEDKMPYVEQDIKWREDNNIPNYEKDW